MQLIKWDKITYEIEHAADIEELTLLKDKLRAYQILAEQSKQSMETQAKISVYKARIDRKCGEWLKENIEYGRPEKGNNAVPLLKDLKLTKNESSRLQKIANIPDKKFEEILLETEIETKKVTRNMLIKIADEVKKNEYRENIKPISLPKGKFQVLYADPPWSYNDKQDTKKLGGAEKHYPTMSISELCEMPVEELTEENAVLFLWTTSPLLEDSFKVITAWGFKYKSSFIWDKIKHNMGHYNSVRHEFLLVCTKGSCTPDNIKLFDSVQSIEKKDKHSEKPEEFRNIIETLYKGEKIELFARVKTKGWVSYGNEL